MRCNCLRSLHCFAIFNDTETKVIPTLERWFGAGYPELAAPLGKLADCYRAAGDLAQQQACARRALGLLSDGTHNSAIARARLGEALTSAGDAATARPLLERAPVRR